MHPDKDYKHRCAYHIRMALIIVVGLIGSVVVQEAPLLRTSILMVEVSGRTEQEVAQEITRKIETFETQTIPFRVGKKQYTFTPKELGATFQIDKTVRDAYQKEISAWGKFKTLLASLLYPRQITIDVDIDEKKLRETLIARVDELDDPEKVAVKFFRGNAGESQEKYVGATTNYKKVKAALKSNLANLEQTEIDVPLMPREYTKEEVEQAQKEVASLSDATLILRAFTPNGEKVWTVELQYRPAWIQQTKTTDGITVGLNRDSVRAYLNTAVRRQVQIRPVDAHIKALPAEDTMYADVSEVARHGVSLDLAAAIDRIIQSVEQKQFDIELPLRTLPSKIVNDTGIPLGKFELLAEGRSNFAGSPSGRAFNIRKGLNEKFTNILIPPSGRFSYNALLGPVTKKYGWQDALAIFGGGGLRKVPGGGLCQVSTTIYRAALLAGFDIVQRSNHSLYVSYYTENGEGLDATIYPGIRDLVFENNTGQYVLIQSYDIDNDAYVRIYGTPDGRKVKLYGPYRWREVTPELLRGTKRGWNGKDIVWFQEITKADSTVDYKQIISRYNKPIPWNKPKGADLVVNEPAT